MNSVPNPADAHAADVFYHNTCKTQLFNAAKSSDRSAKKPEAKEAGYDCLTWAQLVAYVKYNQGPFKLNSLIKLYCDNAPDSANINETRFKQSLLEAVGTEFSAFKSGRCIFISNHTVTGQLLDESNRRSVTASEAQKIVEAGLILHKYAVQKQEPYKGAFPPEWIKNSSPHPIYTLIDVALHGSQAMKKSEGKFIKRY